MKKQDSLPQTNYNDERTASEIVSWNESLSVFKLRYLEEYVTDWNR